MTIENNEATDGRSYGLKIKAGSNASDAPLFIQDHDAANDFLIVRGNGAVGIGTTAPTELLHLKSNTSNKPILILEDTSNDAECAELQFKKITGAASDDERCGEILFKAQADDNSEQNFHTYRVQTLDVSAGAEKSLVTFNNQHGGSLKNVMTFNGENIGIGTASPTAFYPTFQVQGTQPAIIINDSETVAFFTTVVNGTGAVTQLFDHDGKISVKTSTNNGGSSAVLRFEYNNDGTAEKSSGAGDWAGTSDKRLKKNIEDLNVDALDVINSLRPIEFNWKKEELHGNPKDSNGKTYGFLADEVESVMPQLVFESELSEESADREYVDEDGMAKKTELGHMASIYIKAIQQLSEKNDSLEKRIKDLEN